MRILIVGGGIAGLTLAAKLRQQGRTPLVIEKAPEYRDAGYALGLYPLGSCVLHGLGLYDDFLSQGLVPERYEILDERDRLLTSYPMSDFTAQVGPMVMIARSQLVDLLRAACGEIEIRMGTTIASLDRDDDAVSVCFDDGTRAQFDGVVGCDGIDSPLRDLVFGPQPSFDTKWALWTWWTTEPIFPPELAREYWGAGRLLGIYPAHGRAMCAAGGPVSFTEKDSAESTQERIRELVAPWYQSDADVARAVDECDASFLWPMRDVRSRSWRKGRVALCGDAAAAFLPTAGVGASCALRAASALADELSRVDGRQIPFAFELYEQRARRIIEGNQTDSRRLARYMFVRSRVLARGRDLMLRIYPAKWALRSIIKSMRATF